LCSGSRNYNCFDIDVKRLDGDDLVQYIKRNKKSKEELSRWKNMEDNLETGIKLKQNHRQIIAYLSNLPIGLRE